MRRTSWMAALALWAGLTAGCVERRFVVTSDPPGALVLHNGKPIGSAPADDHFIYYGNHDFTLIKDGYETLKVTERIRAPWYQWFPLDFISEVLVPFQIEDVRRYPYQLTPLQAVRPDEQMSRAQILREKGKTLHPSSPPPPPSPAGGRPVTPPTQVAPPAPGTPANPPASPIPDGPVPVPGTATALPR